jgi:uncharacterized protein
MQKIIFISLLTLMSGMALGQMKKSTKAKTPKVHKIVFQLSNGDPEVHKGLTRQLGHILEEAPTTKIEIVCHGPGLDILVDNKTVVRDKITEFTAKGVKFLACENTMKQKNIERSSILPEAWYVGAGIIYIVEKQEQGWSYIKAGN